MADKFDRWNHESTSAWDNVGPGRATTGGAAVAGAVTGGIALAVGAGPAGAVVGALGGAIVGVLGERAMHQDETSATPYW